MYLRSLLSVALCAVLGCSALDSDMPASGTSDAGSRYMLVLTTSSTVAMLPGEARDLSVRYVDASGRPLIGEPVSFGLLGGASGASLSPAQSITDDEGNAVVTLRAGSTLTTFAVRASAPAADPVFIEVQITTPVAPSATVAVVYGGQRAIVSRSVTLVPAMSCETLSQGNKEDVNTGTSFVLSRPEDVAEFKLGSGLTYAAMAWGSDDTNSKLAYGCLNIGPIVTADAMDAARRFEVPLQDTLLRLEPGSFEVVLNLDLSLPLKALDVSAQQAVVARLPQKPYPAAAYFLDALESTFGSFASLRASQGLDAELATLMTQSYSGPESFAYQLAQLVARQGEKASLLATLNVPQRDVLGALNVSRIEAVTDAVRAPPMQGALAGSAELSARFDPNLAAIVVDELSVVLGRGSYASWLLDQNGSPSDVATLLTAWHGCVQVAELVTRHAAELSFAPLAADATCREAVGSLVGSVRAAWLSLDTAAPRIWLRGTVPVHDRDLDRSLGPLSERVANDLGPGGLSGSWSNAYGAMDTQNGVTATLRVPPATALAL